MNLVDVASRIKVDPASGYWMYTGKLDKNGYAHAYIRGRGVQWLHRTVYEHRIGPIPDDLELDHLCRTPHCLNPKHLEPVTHGENVRRGNTFAKSNSEKTHCPRGHPYNVENTYITIEGKRHCRECNRLRCQYYRDLAKGKVKRGEWSKYDPSN